MSRINWNDQDIGAHLSDMVLTHDPTYYYEDGNCTIRVKDRLFKIHRYLLTRDSTFFEKKLSPHQMPPDSDLKPGEEKEDVKASVEGTTDDNPIVCEDSLEEFQSLCWGLYAKATEIRAQDRPRTAGIDNLIQLASITHKYEFKSLHSWAATVLSALCPRNMARRGSTPKTFLESTTQEVLERLLLLARKCKLDFLSLVEAQWVFRIPGYLGDPQSFRKSLDFAEDVNSPEFLARAYYHSLKAMGKFDLGSSTDGKCSAQDIFSGSHISEETMSALSMNQRLRLYRGLWSLLSLHNKLRGVPWIKQMEETCTERAHSRCIMLWSSLWKEDGRQKGSNSIDPGRLIDEAVTKFGCAAFTRAHCYASMDTELNGLKEEFRSRLPEYFT